MQSLIIIIFNNNNNNNNNGLFKVHPLRGSSPSKLANYIICKGCGVTQEQSKIPEALLKFIKFVFLAQNLTAIYMFGS